VRLKTHFGQIVEIKVPPSNVAVAKVGLRHSLVFFGIKHLAEASVNVIAEPHN
jgi:hypothetical protein